LKREIERANGLHGLAVSCANAVLRLDFLRHCADGDQHARAALVELQQAVAQLPDLPLGDDPFCGDGLVEVAGVQGTSTHVGLLQLARRTWQAVHLTSLENGTATAHQDEQGRSFTRVTFENARRAPTEVEWTAEVWREVSERLGQYPSLDRDTVEAALALELNRARRQQEARFGVLVNDTQMIALQDVEVVRLTVSPTRAAEEELDHPPQHTVEEGMSAPQVARPPQSRKEPSKDAIAAYRLKLLTGQTQTELAEQLTKELKRPIDQGTVSRWLRQVKVWLEAGNVLPDLTATPGTKPMPMDPERIELGERRDGRAKHQRGRRNSDQDD
jgi:hypothetical protein